jgi:hypothetical protein
LDVDVAKDLDGLSIYCTLVGRCGFFGVAKVRINISGFLFIMEGKYPHFFPVVEANWSFFYVAEGIGFLCTYVG